VVVGGVPAVSGDGGVADVMRASSLVTETSSAAVFLVPSGGEGRL
jgi:hypothetical protein